MAYASSMKRALRRPALTAFTLLVAAACAGAFAAMKSRAEAPRALPDGAAIAPCESAPEAMACIPGGAFVRGADDGPEDARPASTLWLQTFYMDLYEVTFEQYQACREAGACPKGGPQYRDFSRPKQPITGINWYAAVAYCTWAQKHLPTEAQWEKAARGSNGARTPFGDDPVTCENAVIQDRTGRSCGVPQKGTHPDKGRTFEVGSRPAGAHGLFDMAGNSWEWVYDWYSPSYSKCGAACEGVDPQGPCAGKEPCAGHKRRVVRGGSWYWNASYAMSYYRRSHFPINEESNFHHFGFRCAASVAEAAALRTTAR
jgi:sulfatase modifying factor 1